LEEAVANAFNTQLRAQQEWAWLLAIWLFLGGTGSGLYLLYLLLGLPGYFAALALGLVLSGGVILLLELGSPLRAWRTVFRPGTSWLSRGVFFVFFFIVACFLAIAPSFEWFSWLPWAADGAAVRLLGWAAGLCALMIILYPAFFFHSTSLAIPFWNTRLLPLLFVSYAVLGGGGIVLLLSSYSGGIAAPVELAAVVLIALNAVMIAIYLLAMYRAGGSAQESVRRLNRSPLSWVFWIGVVAVGMILPLSAILFMPSALAAAGAGILLGGLLFRYCVLKAGVYVPFALAAGGTDWSKLNRTSADFEREYAGMAAQSASPPR
jgi:formate-dependent nitrite reductase membrane component NrfD